ncbi:MAG: serine/threonine protein kinase [Labilithrix sp.]|nr:serine/threonine protein kinase [Labilithrix sp.]MCW5809754.1 serine/threonine protein kinase [Labilithrix sp.]
MGRQLPVLITALSAQSARELEEAARVGRDVWVPLEREPAQGGPHVLEVYTAELDVPVRLLAEPLGMRGEHGSALRLRAWPTERTEKTEKTEKAVKTEKARKTPDVARKTLAGGRFELLSLIGEGAVGAVYRARHTGLNTTVAVKVLHGAFQRDTEFCRRFYAEALAMSRLDHANLINIHDFGQEPDGLLYIAMSCVEGFTLRELIQRERRFDVPRVAALMLQVCAGLGHAHGRGLIHRDVKPDNIMIVTKEDDDGHTAETVKVLDFGFAVPPSVSGEVAQRLAGTPVYMSPEQCRGEELDARSDLYACGIMMYELATGTVPFLAHDAVTLRQMHIDAPAPLIAPKRPDIDPRYERIVQRALSKDREHRQANMMELRAELKGLLLPEPTPEVREVRTEGPPSAPHPATPSPPRAAATDDDDWLERGTGYDIRTPASTLADGLARDASSWLGELSRERNPRAFTRRVDELDGAVRMLLERADAKTLSRVSAVVAGLVDHDREEAGRNALAAVARLFANPDLLAPIATALLTRDPGDPQRSAAADLVAQARISGAVALYGARAKLAADPRVRVTFVTTMKSLGASARPVLRAALERLYEQGATGQHRGATELAEDVLLAVPKGNDDLTGELVVKFARSNVASIARAAARALPRVWGLRARPVLLDLVQHEDDGVCLAAVVGLHEMDAIDLEAVARIAAQVAAGRVRTQQLQLAFATALRSATTSARADAMSVLARLPR